MNPSKMNKIEKFHELGEICDNSNAETKINIDTNRTDKPEKKDNSVLRIMYAWQSLPKFYKAMAFIALLNLLFIATLFFYST